MKIIIEIGLLLVMFLGGGCSTIRLAENPKIAEYWTSPHMSEEEAAKLANFHLVIVDMENLVNNPESLRLIKKLNARTKLLAYSNPMEVWGPKVSHRSLGKEILGVIKRNPKWWLKDLKGEPVVFWNGMRMLNLSTACSKVDGKRYNQYIAQFLLERVLSNDIWDGYFMDNSGGNVSWINKGLIDADNNGVKDNLDILDRQWAEGIEEFLTIIRQAKGSEFIMIGNKGSLEFLDILNGKMFEEFPNNYLGDKKADGWYQSIDNYQLTGAHSIVHAKHRSNDEFRLFVLASALIHDGYYSYGQNSGKLFPEYQDIGAALGPAEEDENGAWHRKFAKAEVIVWPSKKKGQIVYK